MRIAATNAGEWVDGDNKVKTETPDEVEDKEGLTQRESQSTKQNKP